MKKEKPGYQKLREDLDAVEALFESKTFEGKFDMSLFGSKTECGTTACLAGWLSLVSKNGFKGYWSRELLYPEGHSTFQQMAHSVYGVPYIDADQLFTSNIDGKGKSALKSKLKEARALADLTEARAKAEELMDKVIGLEKIFYKRGTNGK